MKTIDLTLVRLLQFFVLLFFTFIVFLWYGLAALLPLALWVNLTEFFSGAFGAIMATIISLIIVAALIFYLVKIPKLLETFLSSGIDLMKLGNTSVRRMGDIAAAVKNDAPPQEMTVEIVLKDKMS